MWLIMKVFLLQILAFLLFGGGIHCQASTHRHSFVVREALYTRLCSTKNILTINGRFPGPTIYAKKGETIIVDVYNRGKENVTIHWHGVTMPRYPWTDGPEYITQCPIPPGSKFSQKIILSSEEGTLWWHAHREWWKSDVNAVLNEALVTGVDPNVSDSFLINGQPGDLHPCSNQEVLFFSIAKHKMTVVGIDGSYTKPLTRDYIIISPGQTFDVLLEANQCPDHYYMAARVYSIAPVGNYDNTTTTAIVQYRGYYTPSSPPSLPYLPGYNDTNASVHFMGSLRSLGDAEHPCNVPLSMNTKLIYTIFMNTFPCANNSCAGPNGTRIPQVVFDFTSEYPPLEYETPRNGTKVRMLEYNSTVEIVFQGTNLVAGTHHPMHLHGYSFYVVGWGLGNFDKNRDPLRYNLVDPPLQNTITVLKNGWTAIRFKASNPGVWFMHCHLDRHQTWGMETAFIVKNGRHPEAQMLPPPSDMPPC
ncbi:putative laccase-9 [Vitis vinifera]|uniref:laccase n=1 Tax=Vitis vinifera TaxID=29760 RepID=A0A438BSU4_VITVI|nr:putative laccase-9 [Vitis vinifera]